MNEQPTNTQELLAEGLYSDGSLEQQPLALSEFLVDVARNMYNIACEQKDQQQADAMFSHGMNNFFNEVAEAMGLAISNATDPDFALSSFVKQLEDCVTHYVETKPEADALAQALESTAAAH